MSSAFYSHVGNHVQTLRKARLSSAYRYGKIRNDCGFGRSGCLLTVGQFFHTLRNVEIQHVDGNFPSSHIVSLTIETFHNGFRESAIAPGIILKRILIT